MLNNKLSNNTNNSKIVLGNSSREQLKAEAKKMIQEAKKESEVWGKNSKWRFA